MENCGKKHPGSKISCVTVPLNLETIFLKFSNNNPYPTERVQDNQVDRIDVHLPYKCILNFVCLFLWQEIKIYGHASQKCHASHTEIIKKIQFQIHYIKIDNLLQIIYTFDVKENRCCIEFKRNLVKFLCVKKNKN
jgi:hypothetical protein